MTTETDRSDLPAPPRDPWLSAAYTAAGASCCWSAIAIRYIEDLSNPIWLLPFAVALGLSALIRLMQLHPYRILGLIPVATLFLFIACLIGWLTGPGLIPAVIYFCSLSTQITALFLAIRYRRKSSHPRWNQLPFDKVFFLMVMAISVAVFVIPFLDSTIQEGQRNSILQAFTLGIGAILVMYTWVRLFRPLFELFVEVLVHRSYRIHSVGPATKTIPVHGPLLVIANHACWWDPLFLAKVLPRPVTPMMTSVFYDRWFLKPLMVHVFETIRVEDARVRREAPEIQDAIRSLDEGKCVVLFPEAFLRRKEEIPLRRFGRGVWEILKARPETPVLCCWIEGGWGSYSSYWNGPPTKNKQIVGKRTISVGTAAPIVVPAEKLKHHLETRIHLMNEVSKARIFLELDPLPVFEYPNSDDETAPKPSE